MKRQVKELMTPMPKTIGFDISISKAKSMMHELNCHHLPVLDGGHLVGIISERDLSVSEALEKGDACCVREIMMDEPVVVSPQDTVKTTIQTLLDKKIGSVIVRAEGDSPWGIFTTTDALRLLQSTL